jgi:hypothetical protein
MNITSPNAMIATLLGNPQLAYNYLKGGNTGGLWPITGAGLGRGGAGVGGGGMVALGYHTLTNNGTIRAKGGAASSKGLGYEFNGVLRATSDAGNGGAGAAGIVVSAPVV